LSNWTRSRRHGIADTIYVRLAEGFVYLAAILDAFSCKVIGWAIADHLEASLAIEALDLALAARNLPPDSLIHHSDRRVKYACGAHQERLEKHEIAASMSRVGNPYDNAKAESFMKTLKAERPTPKIYVDIDDARPPDRRLHRNRHIKKRLHSALGCKPPIGRGIQQSWSTDNNADHPVVAEPIGEPHL
jgi:transposase InsO family protein